MNRSTENAKDNLERLRQGDRQAIKELYEQGFPQCASIVLKNSGTREDAKDLFQEALLVLFKNLRTTGFALSCDAKTYLYAVTRNLWLKKLNARNKGGLALVLDDQGAERFELAEEEMEDKMKFAEKHSHISKVLEHFKADCKTLLMSFYFKKMPLKEIAKVMGYTDQFVKVKKNRCMEALRKEVRISFKSVFEE